MEHCQFQFTTSYKIVERYYLLIRMQNISKYIALANFENRPCIVLLILFYTSRHTRDLCFKEMLSIEFNFVNPAYSCTANFKTYCFYFSVIVKSSNKIFQKWAALFLLTQKSLVHFSCFHSNFTVNFSFKW